MPVIIIGTFCVIFYELVLSHTISQSRVKPSEMIKGAMFTGCYPSLSEWAPRNAHILGDGAHSKGECHKAVRL